MSDVDLVRIAFPLDAEQSGGIAIERLWAKPQADGTFLLDNSPFHAYGVSYGDAVYANLIKDGLQFAGIARRGGHSTYRVRLPRGKSHAYFLELWPSLKALECTYEGTSDDVRIYSIDVPPTTSVHHVYEILARLESAGVCEFEEGHYCRVELTAH